MTNEMLNKSTATAIADAEPEFFMRQQRPHGVVQMAKLEGKRRIRTVGGIRRYLIREHGFQFVPKNRTVTVPEEEYQDHTIYRRYLQRSTYFDPFGADHEARKKWQREQEASVDPNLLAEVVVTGNQFTGNAITGVLLYTDLLIHKMRTIPELSLSILQTKRELQAAYRGPIPDEEILDKLLRDQKSTKGNATRNDVIEDYARERYRLLSYDDKLKVVHAFTDSIVKTLWTLALFKNSDQAKQKIRVTGTPRRDRRYAMPAFMNSIVADLPL